MKKFCLLLLIAALPVFVSCQKQQSEEEKRAEVERQVQERLATERQADEAKRLAQQQADLEARERAIAEKEAAAAMTPAEEPAVVPVEREVSETTETTERRSEQRSTASYGMFYEKLDPYGEWRETNDYGYVWQPREAESSRDWRPYTEGRWAYTDVGWTWVSDEKFGWATYHYGRWVRLRRIGWVWVPGDEWAPAWVSWRTSKDYVGWAPLPPEARFDRRSGIHNWADNYYDIGPEQYAFVSSNDFGAEHVRRSVVPAERNLTIAIETTNVTRITFSNTTIVNEGPSYDELRSRGPRTIERYRLRRTANFEPAIISGGELQISQPRIVAEPEFRRPRRIKERVTEVNVDNGWTEIKDRSAAERARTKFRTEATPPPNAPPKKFVKPVEAATPPVTSATAAPSATPAVAPSVATTATPAPIATIAPTVRPSATVVPSVSPTPRVRTSPSVTPRATLAPTASPPPASTVAPTVTPRATLPPATPSPAVTVAPTASPVVSVPPPRATIVPTIRPRPLPSITPMVEPPSADQPAVPIKPEETRKPRPLPRQTLPASTIAPPPATVENTPSVPPQRKIPPPVLNTPAPAAPPLSTVEPAVKPAPPSTPPPTRRELPPRTAPLATPQASAPEAITPVTPPKQLPPRMTPPTVPSPGAVPIAPPATDEKPKEKRPKRPGPLDAEIVTPTPVPSPAPK